MVFFSVVVAQQAVSILLPGLPGENKDSANGEGTGQGGKKSSATRMVTRLRNPESKLSQLKNQQVAAAVHEANKGFKEGKEVRMMMEKFKLHF